MKTSPATSQKDFISTLTRELREASYALATLSENQKNSLLLAIATAIEEQTNEILRANQRDLQDGRDGGASKALLDRLLLSPERLLALAQSVREISRLEDPIGEIIAGKTLRNGLHLIKKRVPLGVVFVIFESRPNVTIDIAALTLKSGNVALLRGGKEARHSNQALASTIRGALSAHKLPPHAVHLLASPDRHLVHLLLEEKDNIDVVIPRGGPSLTSMVARVSRIPVVYHDKGVCHLYINADADVKMAIAIAIDAKTQRPGVCNAIETILFHRNFPGIKAVLDALIQHNVEIRASDPLRSHFTELKLSPAEESDWSAEYLDLIIAAHILPSTKDAIAWIHRYGSGHSDAIVTQDLSQATHFANALDTAAVFINASTRFHDGGSFDMGSEVGISNQKLHVRGPMGLRDLTTYKYIITGSGNLRG